VPLRGALRFVFGRNPDKAEHGGPIIGLSGHPERARAGMVVRPEGLRAAPSAGADAQGPLQPLARYGIDALKLDGDSPGGPA